MSDRRAVLRAERDGDVEALARSLGSHSASVRILALGSLARLGGLTDDHIRDCLDDENRDVRCRAIELIVSRSDQSPVVTRSRDVSPASLVALLSDGDDLVVETTAWALGEVCADASETPETDEVVAALSTIAADHEQSICREAAIAALGAIGVRTGLPAILVGMKDKASVRRRAVLALAPFTGAEVESALVSALGDRDRQVRQAAEDLTAD